MTHDLSGVRVIGRRGIISGLRELTESQAGNEAATLVQWLQHLVEKKQLQTMMLIMNSYFNRDINHI